MRTPSGVHELAVGVTELADVVAVVAVAMVAVVAVAVFLFVVELVRVKVEAGLYDRVQAMLTEGLEEIAHLFAPGASIRCLGLSAGGDAVRICARQQQPAYQIHVALIGCLVQRCLSVGRRLVEVGAARHQIA
jgi:hypothetical protein